MNFNDRIQNFFHTGYKTDSQAIIISCYFNPQNSLYRKKAFQQFYSTIKHLNHHIIECCIGKGEEKLTDYELIGAGYDNKNFTRVKTSQLLWHKETLLNKVIKSLDPKYKYIFWLDCDVIFTNENWLTDGVKKLSSGYNLIQPFEYCFHLEKDETSPSSDYLAQIGELDLTGQRHPMMWRSFAANWEDQKHNATSLDYDTHGHVGFAWGARREVLTKCPLYDHALIGGADHIIAHAGVGQIPHNCITKSFTENIEEVNLWSERFYNAVKGKVGYCKGELFHIWHGDVEKRDYFRRVKDFTPKTKNIRKRDDNGFYITEDKQDELYMQNYFKRREIIPQDSLLDDLLNPLNPLSPIYIFGDQYHYIFDDQYQNDLQQNYPQDDYSQNNLPSSEQSQQNDSTIIDSTFINQDIARDSSTQSFS